MGSSFSKKQTKIYKTEKEIKLLDKKIQKLQTVEQNPAVVEQINQYYLDLTKLYALRNQQIADEFYGTHFMLYLVIS